MDPDIPADILVLPHHSVRFLLPEQGLMAVMDMIVGVDCAINGASFAYSS